jgi:Ala-tRNA(Pro) deacylase
MSTAWPRILIKISGHLHIISAIDLSYKVALQSLGDTIMSIAASVMNLLTELHIEYEVVAHPKSFSSAESAYAAHIPQDHIAKGVLLKDNQGYLLAVIPASQWVDFRRLKAELDRELQLATEDEIERLFSDCDRGAIPPLGETYGVETILDDSLNSLAKVYLEAGDHEQIIKLQADQFKRLMQGVRHGHFSDET